MMQLAEQPFNCTHCGKSFMKEKTLFAHMCEPKRRFMQKDEKRVQTGFYAFNQFYKIRQGSKIQKTYDEFCKSAYYNAFVKFGSFMNNVNPLYPEKFIEFVIKSDVKLDHWCRDELYETYLYEMLKIEPVESACRRTITTMIEWGDTSGAQWNHYFNYVNFNRAVHDIKDGKISAWVILNCSSGKKMLESFNDEQLDLISKSLDIPYWIKHFKSNKEDVAVVREICEGSGIE